MSDPFAKQIQLPKIPICIHVRWNPANEAVGCAHPGCSALLPQVIFRFISQLGTMPYSDDPDGVVLDSVKKPIRTDNHFTKREIRELRQQSSGIGKLFKTG